MTCRDRFMSTVVAIGLIGLVVCANVSFGARPVFQGARQVQFDSLPYTYPPSPFKVKRAKKLGIPVEVETEPSVRVTGYLVKPDGEGPYPAIVLMHGCAGIWEWDEVWSDRLVGWGYVVLVVDSLTPRGQTYQCDGRGSPVAPWSRALDAYGAKMHLLTLSVVDPTSIAVFGMSHGGMAVLEIIKRATSKGLAITPFQAAVALYPLCGEPEAINTPTLVLIGGKDNWTPADQCVRYVDLLQQPQQMTLRVFPNAHHVFDHPGADFEELGNTLRYDPEAAELAIGMIRDFLNERL